MSFPEYLAQRWTDVLALSIEHAGVVLISVAIATVVGMTIGVLVYRNVPASSLAIAITATILTLPSFALFGLMIGYFGLGYWPAVYALTAYALLPIVRNTITGLQGVDPAISESAKGMGMNARQRLVRIELPLAWPVILTGMRVSTMLIVSIAAIASYVGGPGLGEHIFAGLARRGSAIAENLILGGIFGVVAVAAILDLFFQLVGRFTTSKGL